MAEYISPEEMLDAATTIPRWLAFCGTLAPLSSILMFLSPIPTIRQVLRSGTVGDLPLLPYSSMTTSCFVWIVYGILRREPTLWATNMVECILSVYYFVEFTNYAPQQSKTFPGSVYSHIQAMSGIGSLTLFVALFLSHDMAIWTIGNITVALTILTFASPLAAVRAVLESQSSESIPWPFTLAALGNCILWSIVGIWGMHDYYVYFPAVLGILLSLLQVALKVYFGDRTTLLMAESSSYSRAPVEMPTPVLEAVRQVVMFGNSTPASSSYNMLHQHYDDVLHFDRMMNDGEAITTASNATDYVELGVPLTMGGRGRGGEPHHQQPPRTGGTGAAPNLGQIHTGSNMDEDDPLEESILFEGHDASTLAAAPPPPRPFPDSFRSRSISANHEHGHGEQQHP